MTLALPWVWQTIPDLRTLALLCLAGLFGTVGHFCSSRLLRARRPLP